MAFIDLPERSAAWHEFRLSKIGGSEIASLFGEEEQPDPDAEDVTAGFSDSLFSLHYIKSGTIKPRPVEGEIIDAGIYMEPSIARFAADRRGWAISKGRYAIDDTTIGMGASLDYVITDSGQDAAGVRVGGSILRGIEGPLVGPGVLQIKNVGNFQFLKKWINGEPPLYVILQVQHEMACSGYQWGVLAAWVGGNSLRLYYYEARPEVIAMIRSRVTEFWTRVEQGRPPAADGSDATSYALRALYPVLRDNKFEPLDLNGNNEVPELCAKLDRARDQRLDLQKEEKRCKQRLDQIMGDAMYAFCGSWTIKRSVTAENPGRPALPGEIIGARSEVRKTFIKENV